MFELWRPTFTDEHRVVPSAFMERCRVYLARMMDGRFGGTYSPSAPITIHGEGLHVNPLKQSTIEGVMRSRGTARFPTRHGSYAPVGANIDIRDGTLFDTIAIDATGQTNDRVCTLDVQAASKTGETCFIYVEPHATYDTKIRTLSVATPLITFGSGAHAGYDPEWCAVWFDETRTGTNADGEWALLAHGISP